MGVYRGIVTHSEESEKVRLYLLGEQMGEYVDFAVRDAAGIEADADEGSVPTHTVDVDDSALTKGSVDLGDFDRRFSDAGDRSTEGFARFARELDVRDPDRSLDGTHFRCCHTSVYC